jgi:aminoglycoside phosphotransferase (APT) family kinase protein
VVDIAAETAGWVENVTGARVLVTAALVGGVSSSVHRCRLDDGRDVVVRHIDDAEWLAREPYLISAEATALGLAAGSGLPVPEHLASDGCGGRLLMTLLTGRPRIDREHLASTVDRFAAVAVAIAAVDVPSWVSSADSGLPSWRPWAPRQPEPPVWGSRTLWERAIAAYRSRPPQGSEEPARPVLLHRDLHPLNLLWEAERLTGVVDWVNACVGHPHVEVYHARLNLAILGGLDLAEEFLDRYLEQARSTSGVSAGADVYDPRWDLETPISLASWPPDGSAWRALGRGDLTDERVWAAIEEFMAAALDQL